MAFTTGGAPYQQVIEVSLHPSAITSTSVSVETFSPSTLAALDPASCVYVSAVALETGLAIVSARIPSAGVLELTIWNPTTGTITPAAQNFKILVF